MRTRWVKPATGGCGGLRHPNATAHKKSETKDDPGKTWKGPESG